MTKVYELPNGHRMIADIDESTRVCNITETTLDSIVSKLNYYAEQTDALDKIKAEIKRLPYQRIFGNVSNYSLIDAVIEIIDKYKAESEDKE